MEEATAGMLSAAQRLLWRVNARRRGWEADSVRTAYRLTGPLDTAALGAALGAVVQRHDLMRTVFAPAGSEAIPVCPAPRAAELPIEDVTGLGAGERAAAAQRRLDELARRPFDLAAGPLYRFHLVRQAPQEHVLLVVLHCSIADAGSIEPFERELSALYGRSRAATGTADAPLLLQYSGFVQRENSAGPSFRSARDLAYWREALAAAPPRTEFPADFSRRSDRLFPAASASVTLDVAAATRLAALGRSRGATLFETVLAALNVLLFRYTGQTDVIVGCPAHQRQQPDEEPLIGPFANITVLRTRLDQTASFEDVLSRSQAAAAAAFAHHELPFVRIVEELQPAAGNGELPWVNVLFAGAEQTSANLRLPGLRVAPHPVAAGSALADLHFSYAQEVGGLVCSLRYAADLFDAATIRRVLAALVCLMESIADAPAEPIGNLALLARGESPRLPDVEAPGPLLAAPARAVHERFAEQAARTPDAAALVDGALTLTYRDLNGRANQLARALLDRGVQREEIVAIALPRSASTIVSMLAILKAGAAYLPLDPDFPVDRSRSMLADAGARLVITRGSGDEIAPAACRVNPDAAELDRSERTDFALAGEPSELAYVMFTSGSTGRPKGVLITHRAIANLATAVPALAIGTGDVVAQLSNIAFDGATYEIWGALLNGARLEIIGRDVMLDADAFDRTLIERGISVAFLTGALLRHISRERPAAFARLRCLIAGGEVLDPTAVRAIFAHGPPRRLLNGYGPSETTTFATVFEIGAPPDGPIPIGRPLDNVETYILDGARNPVPVGVPGQLYIGGIGLARGYLNDAERTAERFIRHPFRSEPQARLYATGDIARHLPDGNIAFLGRADRQLKIRGFRIEPAEIEAALRALPGVRDAVALLHGREPDAARLVAYAVVDDGAPARDAAAWRAALARQLPDYMLPEAVVSGAKLPLNTNGKIDGAVLDAAFTCERARAAAPERTASAPAPEGAFSGPEAAVARIFADVLGLGLIDRQANFFAIGGHSLLAAQAIARIGDRLGVQLSLRDFFSIPTVAGVAQRLAGAPPRASRPIRPAAGAHAAELTEAQLDALLADAQRE